MRRLLGRSQSVGRSCLLPSRCIILTTAMLCYGGCGNQYIKEPPPKAELCGDWCIDLDRTRWKNGAPLLQAASQAGRLSLRPDGTFSFREMPDISFTGICTFTPTFHHYGDGEWWTNVGFDGIACLWLDIKEMNGQHQQQSSGIAHYRRNGGGEHKYLLCFGIMESDTDEVLVLKRAETGISDHQGGIGIGDITDIDGSGED